DFDGDGAWDGDGEQIFDAEPLVAGSQQLTYSVPNISLTNLAQARFRASSTGGLSVGGAADNGEVEDHLLVIDSRAPQISLLSDDGGSALVDCSSTNRPPRGFIIAFDEPMAGADLIDNYRVISAGDDRDLQTTSCADPLAEADLEELIQSVTVGGDPASTTSIVTLASPPADGPLRILVCDTLTDIAGNALDGDVDGIPGGDASRSFRVDRNNRFVSGHFDCERGLDDWVQVATPPDVWLDDSEDVDDASFSGSALLLHDSQEASALAQCVSLAGGRPHRLAAAVRFSAVAAGSAVSASLLLECELSSTPDCRTPDLGLEQSSSFLADSEDQWRRFELGFIPSAAAQSASCSFGLRPVFQSGTWNAELDELFVGIDAMIFGDDFETGDFSAWSAAQP
ncbi:MAG: GEVED domain-containing protein, partial [Acidobacteriota bacterium]